MNDSKFLHILKELPAWVVLLPTFLILLALIFFGKFESESIVLFLQRLADGTLGALLLSLNARRPAISNEKENK